MTKFFKVFSANRIAAVLHVAFMVLTAVALFLAAINHSLPQKWQATLAIVIGIVGAVAGATVTVTKFLTGSQNYDNLTAHYVANRPTPSSGQVADTPGGGGDLIPLLDTSRSEKPETARTPDAPTDISA